MSDFDLEHFKKLLLKRREVLQEELTQLKESAKPVDLDEPIGRLSRMDAMQQQQMALNAKELAELSLKQVEVALKKIEDESYGYCQSCEEKISVKRLEAKPEALLCIHCQK